jgi:hypothetical protein
LPHHTCSSRGGAGGGIPMTVLPQSKNGRKTSQFGKKAAATFSEVNPGSGEREDVPRELACLSRFRSNSGGEFPSSGGRRSPHWRDSAVTRLAEGTRKPPPKGATYATSPPRAGEEADPRRPRDPLLRPYRERSSCAIGRATEYVPSDDFWSPRRGADASSEPGYLERVHADVAHVLVDALQLVGPKLREHPGRD